MTKNNSLAGAILVVWSSLISAVASPISASMHVQVMDLKSASRADLEPVVDNDVELPRIAKFEGGFIVLTFRTSVPLSPLIMVPGTVLNIDVDACDHSKGQYQMAMPSAYQRGTNISRLRLNKDAALLKDDQTYQVVLFDHSGTEESIPLAFRTEPARSVYTKYDLRTLEEDVCMTVRIGQMQDGYSAIRANELRIPAEDLRRAMGVGH